MQLSHDLNKKVKLKYLFVFENALSSFRFILCDDRFFSFDQNTQETPEK